MSVSMWIGEKMHCFDSCKGNVARKVNKTIPRLKIMNVFVTLKNKKVSGADIMRATQIKSGTLYPNLILLERNGLLKSQWEEGDPKTMGRPRKRLYSITGNGIALIDEWNEDIDRSKSIINESVFAA